MSLVSMFAGHLAAVLEMHQEGGLTRLNDSMVQVLHKLKYIASATCQLAMGHVKGNGETYYK